MIFSDAKNGEQTCALDGRHFHSAYNPSREAEQFVRRIVAPFVPQCIVIIEPALSYCVPFLRARFATTRLCAIRITADFSAIDAQWDVCLSANAAVPLQDQLFRTLGEETLCATLFFAWTASEQIFPEQTQAIWRDIKAAVLKSRDVLATRAFFARRWIKNALRFCTLLHNPALVSPGTADIIVAASGPSLRSSLDALRAHRADFFLIAVSSALVPLIHHDILPDLVISTDGGYWAKRHLAESGYDFSSLPFAIAAEGACPAAVLEKQRVVPLVYADGVTRHFFEECKIPAQQAEQNGTVSGTAARFALALTSGNVYMCGLDLASATGFQHTQPNALENRAEKTDFRLATKETRTVAAQYASEGALALYRNWFSATATTIAQRLFRLSDGYSFPCTLGTIQDVDWQYAVTHVPKQAKKPHITPILLAGTPEERKKRLRNTIRALMAGDAFTSELCPVETIMQKRAATEAERTGYESVIAEKKQACLQELERWL